MMTFRAPPEGAPGPPTLQAMAMAIMSILPSSGSSGTSSVRLFWYRRMPMGRNMAARAWSEMKEARGAMMTKKIRVIMRGSGTASFLNIIRQTRLSTPVLTNAAANMRLPMMNHTASSQ